jgi:hypothetical protein
MRLSVVGPLGGSGVSKPGDDGADLAITVGGLTSRPSDVADEHLDWLSQKPLNVGDVISMEVVETSRADAPIGGKEAAKKQHDEREYFEQCKAVYLRLREKYEG